MVETNNHSTQQIHPASLTRRMLQGAGIALIVIIIFLLGAGKANPAWSKLWMLRPLIIVPLAGAAGAAFYYLMDYLRYQGGWRKILANIIGIIAFLLALWIGAVLGLDGTMWN
jgi:membrane associated rhomboid family serine protease